MSLFGNRASKTAFSRQGMAPNGAPATRIHSHTCSSARGGGPGISRLQTAVSKRVVDVPKNNLAAQPMSRRQPSPPGRPGQFAACYHKPRPDSSSMWPAAAPNVAPAITRAVACCQVGPPEVQYCASASGNGGRLVWHACERFAGTGTKTAAGMFPSDVRL